LVPAGALLLTGNLPSVPGQGIHTATGTLTLVGNAPPLESSADTRLTVEWAILHAADIPLSVRWTVLPVVVVGSELQLTWRVVEAAPLLGLTWHVIPADILDLFDSDGTGAAAGIGEDVLLPVGRVTRE
jgi:hypothetical protein